MLYHFRHYCDDSFIIKVIIIVICLLYVCTVITAENPTSASMPGDKDDKLPGMKQGPALNQDRPAVSSTEQAFNDEPQVLNQTRTLVGLPRMMIAACIVLLTVNSDLYQGRYYYYYYYYKYYKDPKQPKYVDFEAVRVLYSFG